MRLLFITPEFVTESSYSGGLANYLGRVTVALAGKGHNIHVITRSDKAGDLEFEGVHVHRVVPWWGYGLEHLDPRIPRKYYPVYQDIKGAWAAWQRWRALRQDLHFDLIQLANVQAVGLFFRWERKTPIVMRMSSYRPTWDTLAGVADVPGAKLRWKLEKAVAEASRHLYAPSHFVARQIEANYRVPSVDVIETPFFQENIEGDRSVLESAVGRRPYLLFFGRMTQMKGVQHLVEALPKLLDQYPELNAVLIGGDGVAPQGGSMHSFVRQKLSGYANRIHLLDSVRHDKLYPFVAEARVVAIPSLVDNLPNTCLEAMGLGKVVVATTGSCFEQLIIDGQSGFLSVPGDPIALANSIDRAWRVGDDDRRRIGQAAQLRIAELHPDVAVPRLEKYFQNIIKESGRKTLPSSSDYRLSETVCDKNGTVATEELASA